MEMVLKTAGTVRASMPIVNESLAFLSCLFLSDNLKRMLGFFKVLLTYSGIGHCANAFFVSILWLIFSKVTMHGVKNRKIKNGTLQLDWHHVARPRINSNHCLSELPIARTEVLACFIVLNFD